MNTISTEDARRLLLGAQGLLADPARKATRTMLARLIKQMGFVQIDSIIYIKLSRFFPEIPTALSVTSPEVKQ